MDCSIIISAIYFVDYRLYGRKERSVGPSRAGGQLAGCGVNMMNRMSIPVMQYLSTEVCCAGSQGKG